jgi:hypothetical protein
LIINLSEGGGGWSCANVVKKVRLDIPHKITKILSHLRQGTALKMTKFN